jgi:hypothetical protein
MELQVPADYPQRCAGLLDCLVASRPITAQLTVVISGRPLQPTSLLNTLRLSSADGAGWSGELQLQLRPGMASYATSRVIDAPAMAGGGRYSVSLLMTGNGWAGLRVVATLDYAPN